MADDFSLRFQDSIDSREGHRYEVLQWLGRGGNATTYLMLCTSGLHHGIPFAVKIFRRISQPERREKFLQEFDFLQDCEHPAILKVVDEGVFREEHPFLVAEYLPSTLATIVRGAGATMVEKLSYALQLVSALGYLERLDAPIIHRDIKPQNIFVKGRSCVLGDFGLLKRQPDQEEDRGAFLRESVGPGMPFFYRSPDQVAYARGEAELTTKSDVFQLGLVLAELFSGRNPERRAENDGYLSDVVLDEIGFIPGFLHKQIRNLLEDMLQFDSSARPVATNLLNSWQGIFQTAAERFSTVEGRVF